MASGSATYFSRSIIEELVFLMKSMSFGKMDLFLQNTCISILLNMFMTSFLYGMNQSVFHPKVLKLIRF